MRKNEELGKIIQYFWVSRHPYNKSTGGAQKSMNLRYKFKWINGALADLPNGVEVSIKNDVKACKMGTEM